MVAMHEPETMLRLEAPAGVVEMRAACRDGRVESVELTNVPSFVDAARRAARGRRARHDHRRRRVRRHVVRDRRRGRARIRDRAARGARALRVGERIRAAAREQLPCVHPENAEIAGVSIVQIAEPWQGVGAVTKNAVVVAPGRLDRSATGTGLSARMAVLHARGADEGRRHDDARIARSARRSTAASSPRRRSATTPRSCRRFAAALHHRDHRALRRPRRSVPRGLPALGHLARATTSSESRRARAPARPSCRRSARRAASMRARSPRGSCARAARRSDRPRRRALRALATPSRSVNPKGAARRAPREHGLPARGAHAAAPRPPAGARRRRTARVRCAPRRRRCGRAHARPHAPRGHGRQRRWSQQASVAP